MTISRMARLVAPEGVLVRELDGESVLLNLKSESYFGLDEIGTHMWSVLTSSVTIQSAHENLLAEYEVEPEKLSQDLDNLIEMLVSHGLVEVTGG